MSGGSVYFIECSGRIKIGYSKNVHDRLRKFSTGSAFKFSLIGAFPGTRQDEHALHQLLAEHRVHGEWFVDCPAVRLMLKVAETEGLPEVPSKISDRVPRRTSRRVSVPSYQEKPSPLHPVLLRVEASAQRHFGEFGIHCHTARHARAGKGFAIISQAMEEIKDAMRATPTSCFAGDGLANPLLVTASAIAGRLERDLNSLFAVRQARPT